MNKKLKSVISLTAFFTVLSLSAIAGPVNSQGIDEKKIEDVTKKVSPAVVRVEARNTTKKVATGVIIDKDGYIVTTALISPRDEKITITTADGKRIDAEFLGMDTETNLALIQAKDKSLTPIELGDSSELSPGSWIGVVSFSPENTPAITQGIISSISEDRLRLNVWVVPGSSGSPVVNSEGKMVGLLRGSYAENKPVVFEFREKEYVGSGYVLSKAEAPASGMAVAVPVDVVKTVASEIKKSGKVQRGWIGVSIAENEDGKVEIINVERESPGELAKLREGDIILSLDGKDITSSPMLVSEIRKRKPGQDVNLKIEREGKTMDVRVKLGEPPEQEARRELEWTFPKLFPPLPPEAPRAMPEKTPKPPLLKRFFSWEKKKYIGVYLEELNKGLSEYFGVKEGTGLLVSRLTKDSPAEKAGLKIGDVIVKVDGGRVETVSGLSEIVQDKKKGDKIKLEIIRDKKTMKVEVEVEVEEEEGGDFFNNPYEWDSYLESMNKYNKALELQLKESQTRSAKEMAEGMKKINEEFAKQYKDYGKVQSEALKKIKKSMKYYSIHRV